MLRRLFTVIVVLVCTALVTTPVHAAKTAAMVKKYYQLLYRAERAAIAGDYSRAVACYDSSTKTGITPVATDIYNHAICAVMVKDYHTVQQLCQQLAVKGADLMFFDKEVFHDFMQSPEGQQFVSSFLSYRAIYQARISQPIIRSILDLVATDEALHHTPHNSPQEANLFQIKDDSLAKVILSYMLANDCLSEEVIGANFHEQMLAQWPLKDFLFRHDMIAHTAAITNALRNAVATALVKPETALQTLTFSNMAAYGFLNDYYIMNNNLVHGTLPGEHETNTHFDLLSDQKFPAKTKVIADWYLDEPRYNREKMIFCYRQFLSQSGLLPGPRYPDFIFSMRPRMVPPGYATPGTKEEVIDDPTRVHP
ncbi:MAG: hypothetical protein EBZ77_09395 [Chitinophagia bacterium]|nr:hypothetical protein [Chitinophagia bacterium]